MTADQPTILATCGGMKPGRRTDLEYGPLVVHAVELSGVTGRAPRVCQVDTAGGDQRFAQAQQDEAGRVAGIRTSHLTLFPQPNVADTLAFLLEQDVIWVNGGSVVNLLAVWRAHGLPDMFAEAWRQGVVLAGGSAGAVCWHSGGTTSSFGPEIAPVDNGLGFLPYSCCVHYDSDPARRPLYHQLVRDRRMEDGFALDEGAGVVYRGTEVVDVVTDIPGNRAYRVRRSGDGAVTEEPLEARLLS
jgi:peptidase E